MIATPPRAVDTLSGRLRLLARRVQSRPGPTLVSVAIAIPLCDPLAVFTCAAGVSDRVYWDRPSAGITLAGIGAAWTCESAAPAAVSAAWQALSQDALVDGPCWDGDGLSPLTGPLLVGGFAFDPLRPRTDLWDGFPAARFVLPRLAVASSDASTLLVARLLVSPDRDLERDISHLLRDADRLLASADACARPAMSGLVSEDLLPRERWEALVTQAARCCGEDMLDKVVLARGVRARSADGSPFDTGAALRHLRLAYPNAYIFAIGRGDSVFLGATPERLARLRDGIADVACLAGSAPRGATPDDDERLGHALLASAKEREEHAIVVRMVCDGLSGICRDLRVPAAPRLLRLGNVQHLYTPVQGRVRDGITILDLVERLHPTPAVGGYPRAAALRFIREHEELDRGWYAAPVGWMNRHGDGDFAVALRSALVRGCEATLFAGCGIVSRSQPAAEYAETLLKLRPMISALAGNAS